MNPALTPPELRGLLQNAGCADVGGRGGGVCRPAPCSRRAERVSDARPAGDGTAAHRRPSTPTTTGTPWSCSPAAQPGSRRRSASPTGNSACGSAGCRAPFRADARPAVSMMCVPFFHVGGSLGMLGSLYSGNTSVVQTALRRRRVVAPGGRASGDGHIPGADDVAADPRPSRFRRHRSDVAGRHRLRRRRRARRPGAQGDGRAAACGVRQRVRPDRDARRVHDPDARRSSRSQPGGIRSAARCPGWKCEWWTPPPATTSRPERSASCG